MTFFRWAGSLGPIPFIPYPQGCVSVRLASNSVVFQCLLWNMEGGFSKGFSVRYLRMKKIFFGCFNLLELKSERY